MILLFSISTLMAQDAEKKKKDKPVRNPFESGMIIDNQTVFIPEVNTLEFVVEHRFGTLKNGLDDMFGLYAPSNIRMGLNYSLKDYLQVGIGATKDRKLTDFRLKWNIIQQTRSGRTPLSISFYGNFAIDGRDKENFGLEYKFSNRFSFFSQIIIARKFNDAISLQVAPSFSHINSVEKGLEHDKYGLSFGGRVKISTQSSIIFNCDFPLHIEGMQEHVPLNFRSKPNISFGWEISTGTHVFQLFLGTASTLSPQYNMMTNAETEFMIGFFINRLWSF